MRYTRQHHKFDCASTAIANACKWSGSKFSYKENKLHFNYLYEDDGINDGISIKRLTKFLFNTKLPFKTVKYKKYLSLENLYNIIENKQACILLVVNNDMFHTCLLIGLDNKYATVVNWSKEKTVQKLTIKNFKKYLNLYTRGYIVSKHD